MMTQLTNIRSLIHVPCVIKRVFLLYNADESAARFRSLVRFCKNRRTDHNFHVCVVQERPLSLQERIPENERPQGTNKLPYRIPFPGTGGPAIRGRIKRAGRCGQIRHRSRRRRYRDDPSTISERARGTSPEYPRRQQNDLEGVLQTAGAWRQHSAITGFNLFGFFFSFFLSALQGRRRCGQLAVLGVESSSTRHTAEMKTRARA